MADGVSGDDYTGAMYYRADGYIAGGHINQTVRLAVPPGIYDNAAGGHKAIMLAGARLNGVCILLATGVIVAQEGDINAQAAEITANTICVIFKLTTLTAEVKAAADGAFQTDLTDPGIIQPGNQPLYGTTKIDQKTYPWFGIAAEGDPPLETSATLALSGWEDFTGNNTQRFIHKVYSGGESYLSGYSTGDGDEPLSTGSVKVTITNTAGPMADGEPMGIRFTSMSTESGMGWLPVRLAVQGFGEAAQGQVKRQIWYVGNGIMRDQFDGGPQSIGAGIVIIHGDKRHLLVYLPDNSTGTARR